MLEKLDKDNIVNIQIIENDFHEVIYTKNYIEHKRKLSKEYE